MTYLVLFFKINIKNGGKNMNTAKDGFKILSSKAPRIEIPRDEVCGCATNKTCNTGNHCTVNYSCRANGDRPGF